MSARTSIAIRLALSFALALTTAPVSLQAQAFAVEEATIAEVHAAFRSGDLTCEGLVESYLARIDAYDKQGPLLNSIAVVNPRALEEARSLDAAFASGGLTGPLHCIPVLLKDQVETSDMPTTYGSALFEGYMSERDGTIVTRMKDAGALIHAKTNMGEFASRYVGSGFGIIRNAYDPRRNPSGSSGGTGSGVAANLGMIGIGEDTGGSIRGPAAVASLVGLRPTLPLVSRFGMMPANPTTDTMGPMTRTVTDAAILLDVIAGYDPNDPVTAYSVGQVPDSYAAGLDAGALAGARIGVIREPMDRSVDTTSEGFRQVRARMEATTGALRDLGADVFDVAIPGIERVSAIFGANSYETEEVTYAYLAELRDPPYRHLAFVLLSRRVNPWRARRHGRSPETTRDRLLESLLTASGSGGRDGDDGGARSRRLRLRHLRPPAGTDRRRCGDEPRPERPLRPRRQPLAEPADGLPGAHGPRRVHGRRPPRGSRVPGTPVHGGDAPRFRLRLRAGDAPPPPARDRAAARSLMHG